MRIAFISYEYPPDSCNGGIATYAAQATAMLRARGHSVEVFASTPHQARTESLAGVTVHWINEPRMERFVVHAGHAFALAHQRLPFDVLETPEFNCEGAIAKTLVPEIPLLVKLHTPTSILVKHSRPKGLSVFAKFQIDNARDLLKRVVNRQRPRPWQWDDLEKAYTIDQQERDYTDRAELVLGPCQWLCEFAAEQWGIDPAKIRFLPNPYSPSDSFLQLQPKASATTVGFVGRLERKKGVEGLARAIPLIHKANPKLVFRFVGTIGSHRETGLPYDQWIRKTTKVPSHLIEFPGKVPLDQMASVYDSLDICVFPSLWENFPNVCLEAMSAARAIVGSKEGGMRDMLEPTGAGILVDPTNAASIARSVLALASDDQRRIELGLAARQRVLDEYTPERMGAITEAVYEEAIERARSATKPSNSADSKPKVSV